MPHQSALRVYLLFWLDDQAESSSPSLLGTPVYTRHDLAGLVDRRVGIGASTGANAGAKAATIVAGMAAGADSINDVDLLRHGGMGMLFDGVYAPSTLGRSSGLLSRSAISKSA